MTCTQKVREVKFIASTDGLTPFVNVGETSQFVDGMQIIGDGVPADTIIVAVGATTLTLNRILPEITDGLFSAIINQRTVSGKIKFQIPAYIADAYPEFVAFVEAYYEWMELEGNAIAVSQSMPDILGIDTTPEKFIDSFRKQYLYSVPFQSLVGERKEEYTFSTDLAYESAFDLTCVCETPTNKTFVPANSIGVIDLFDLTHIRGTKWFVTVKDTVSGLTQSAQVLAVGMTASSVDYVVYSNIGDEIPDIEIFCEPQIGAGGEVFTALKVKNMSADLVQVSFVRAPTFVETVAIGSRRTYIMDTPFNRSTQVAVFLNGVLLTPTQYIVGQPVSYCEKTQWPITIRDEVPLNYGDEIKVVVTDNSQFDERLLIKNIQEIYKTKGTEASVRLLFRLLYDEEIFVDYPQRRILKVSDAKWNSKTKSIRVPNTIDTSKFLFQRFKVVTWNDLIGSDVEIGSGVIDKIATTVSGKYSVADLYVTSVRGGPFVANPEMVYRNNMWRPRVAIVVELDGVKYYTPLLDSVTSVEATTSGSGYASRNGLLFDSTPYQIDLIWQDGASPRIPLNLGGALSNGIVAAINFVSVAGTATPTFQIADDAILVTSDSSVIQTGDIIRVSVIPAKPLARVESTDTDGGITGIKIIDQGFCVSTGSNVSVENGVGAVIEFATNPVRSYVGFYENQDSQISSIAVLQDGRIYGPYSYIIQSSKTLDQYLTMLKSFAHPAGFNVNGQVIVGSCATMQQLADESVSIPNVLVEIDNENEVGELARPLGPHWTTLDSYKFLFGDDTQVGHFDDFLLDFIDEPWMKHDFLPDSDITLE